MDQVIQAWEADFRPVQHDVESLGCLTQGRRAIRQPMGRDDRRNGSSTRGPSHPRPGSRGSGGASSQSPGRQGPPEPAVDPPWLRDPAPSSPVIVSTRPARSAPAASIPESPEVSSDTWSGPAYAPAAPRADHFNRDRSYASASASAPSSIAGKKKPPPPPPPSNRLFVTARYDFGGQGPGDLSFREGDRIRVLRKTESTDDWWEGELRGVKGSFPANYCG